MRCHTKFLFTIISTVILTIAIPVNTSATEIKPNKRRGQVYFRMVCTVCHVKLTSKTIPPAGRTMAKWRAYFKADKHDASGRSNTSVRYYTSRAYRESVKENNKAAKKFLKLSDAQLYADVREFTIAGAKDSDTPATCK